jgi:hypothetical protein
MLVGTQVGAKRPSVHGVLVNGPVEWADGKHVQAEGILFRVVTVGGDPFARIPGTNTWYELRNPMTGQLADAHLTKRNDNMGSPNKTPEHISEGRERPSENAQR